MSLTITRARHYTKSYRKLEALRWFMYVDRVGVIT